MQYLQGTKDLCLKFVKDDTNLEDYADTEWVSNRKDRNSYAAFVFKLSNSIVALSSTEAEYIALGAASKEVI